MLILSTIKRNFSCLLFSGLALAYVILLNLTPEVTSDVWWLLKVGQVIFTTGHIPRTIQFAMSPVGQRPYIAHEWLAALFWYLIYRFAGFVGIVWLKVVFGVLIYGLVAGLAFKHWKDSWRSQLLAALILSGINFRFHARPELIAWLSLMLELNLLDRFLETKNRVWLVAVCPVGYVWTNSHGSFPISVAIPALLIAGILLETLSRKSLAAEYRRSVLANLILPLMGLCVSLGLLSGCSPLGFSLIQKVFSLNQEGFIDLHIYEWAPTLLVGSGPYLWCFFGYLTLLIFVFAKAKPRNLRFLPLLFAFVALGFRAVRHIPLVYFASLPFLIDIVPPSTGLRRPQENWLITAGFAASIIFLFVQGNFMGLLPGFYRLRALTPGAEAFLDQSALKGNVYNSMMLGGELAFRYDPNLKIGIDSRFDAYGAAYIQNYLVALHSGLRRTEFFKKYRIDYAVLEARDLSVILDSDPAPIWDWYVIYSDSAVSILSKAKLCGPAVPCYPVKDLARRTTR